MHGGSPLPRFGSLGSKRYKRKCPLSSTTTRIIPWLSWLDYPTFPGCPDRAPDRPPRWDSSLLPWRGWRPGGRPCAMVLRKTPLSTGWEDHGSAKNAKPHMRSPLPLPPPHALGSALVEADSSRSCLKKWKSKSLREMTWHKLRDLAQTGVLVHTEAHGFGGEFVALPGTTHFRAKQGRNPNRSHKGVVFSP